MSSHYYEDGEKYSAQFNRLTEMRQVGVCVSYSLYRNRTTISTRGEHRSNRSFRVPLINPHHGNYSFVYVFEKRIFWHSPKSGPEKRRFRSDR